MSRVKRLRSLAKAYRQQQQIHDFEATRLIALIDALGDDGGDFAMRGAIRFRREESDHQLNLAAEAKAIVALLEDAASTLLTIDAGGSFPPYALPKGPIRHELHIDGTGRCGGTLEGFVKTEGDGFICAVCGGTAF